MDSHRQLLALVITQDVSADDKQYVCKNLYDYNVTHTASLLQKPGIDINLVLKDSSFAFFDQYASFALAQNRTTLPAKAQNEVKHERN